MARSPASVAARCPKQVHTSPEPKRNAVGAVVPASVKRGMIRMAYDDYYRTEPERPVIVTVLGILGIVAGALALLSVPVSLIQLSGAFPMPGAGGQVMQDPTVRNWSILATTVGSLIGVLSLAAGIGLLGMRRWAWLLAIGTLVAGMVWQIVSAIVMHSLDIMGKMWTSMGAAADPNTAAMMQMMQRMTGVFTIFGMIFWLAVYATVLILITLPNVREVFENR